MVCRKRQGGAGAGALAGGNRENNSHGAEDSGGASRRREEARRGFWCLYGGAVERLLPREPQRWRRRQRDRHCGESMFGRGNRASAGGRPVEDQGRGVKLCNSIFRHKTSLLSETMDRKLL